MAFDEGLAERLRTEISEKMGGADFVEKKMFGGLAFMINGNMCVGIVKEDLMARVGLEQFDQCLALSGARDMDFTGRPMKGYVFVDSAHLAEDQVLTQWVDYCLAFNKTLPAK